MSSKNPPPLPIGVQVCDGTIAVGTVKHDCPLKERCRRHQSYRPENRDQVRLWVGMKELKPCEHFWEGEDNGR